MLAAAILGAILAVGQDQQPPPSRLQAWRHLFENIPYPVVLDASDIDAYLATVIDEPCSRDEAMLILGNLGRQYERLYRGLIFRRVDKADVYGTFRNDWTHLTWLAGLEDEQLATLLQTGIPLENLDDRSLSVWMVQSAGDPNFGHKLLDGDPAQVGLTVQLDISGEQDGRPIQIDVGSPIPPPAEGAPRRTDVRLPAWLRLGELTFPPIAENEPSIDFQSGYLGTIGAIANIVAKEAPVFVRYDNRLRDSRIFIRGQWAVQDLAEAIAKVMQTRQTVFQDIETERKALQAAYDNLLRLAVETQLGEYAALLDAGKNMTIE